MVQFLSATRGLNIDEHNILMTHGAQMAIYLAAKMILKPGATVITGEPNYFLADTVFRQSGAKLLRVPVDEHGMDVEAVARMCRKKRPDLLYIIHHHHHPTTVTLSADRRMKLLELAILLKNGDIARHLKKSHCCTGFRYGPVYERRQLLLRQHIL